MSCNCSAAELAARSQPLVGWLVDSPPSPHAPPRLASPSRRERGECSAAEGHRRRRLRVRRRPAPPEPTGPRHRGRLIGNGPEEAQLCLHQEQLISQSGLLQCVRLSFTGTARKHEAKNGPSPQILAHQKQLKTRLFELECPEAQGLATTNSIRKVYRGIRKYNQAELLEINGDDDPE